MKKQFKKSRRWIVFISIVLAFVVYVNLQNNWIEVEHMDVKIDNLPKELEGLKIAHISDVHIPKNASSIENLVSKLQKENPDLIVITGDIIDESADIDDPQLSELCRSLANIADTYAVTGNHEVWNNNIEKWKTILYENNVKVVEHIIGIYYKGNTKLAIMGLKDNRSYSYEYFSGIETVKDTPKILLAHRPELFYAYCADYFGGKPDLVFSGHAHGGQFRIPFLNKGIVAPNQGFFPKYTSGLYISDNGVQMIVSRGLGNSIIPIRINNRPHLPIIHLK